MDSLSIVDCLFKAFDGDSSAKNVFIDYVNNLRKNGFDQKSIIVKILHEINVCSDKKDYGKEERELSFFIAGMIYQQI